MEPSWVLNNINSLRSGSIKRLYILKQTYKVSAVGLSMHDLLVNTMHERVNLLVSKPVRYVFCVFWHEGRER